jgi:hypothetical protein
MLHAAWTEIHDPVAVSVDVSRFDQHVSEVALRWAHQIYRFAFRHDAKLDLLNWCLSKIITNVGRVYTSDETGRKVKVVYNTTGGRKSGDMDTSLGNKLEMCGLLFSYYKGHLGFQPRVDFNVVDNGDDAVIILSRVAYARYLRLTGQTVTLRRLALVDPSNFQAVYLATQQVVVPGTHQDITDWFTTMGFSLKIEGTVVKFEKIEFCQTQPCFIDGRWIMVRDLKALSKDTSCLKNIDVATQWIGQVRTGGLACYGSVPIFSAFYAAMPQGNKEFKREELYGTGLYFLAKGMSSKGEVTDANRIAFYNTFGVTPREQEVIEETYRGMVFNATPTKAVGTRWGLTLPLPV